MKVIIGMSGGVDSSFSAYLLKSQGYEVEGLSMILMEMRGKCAPNVCCSIQAVEDAHRTANYIGIPHSVIDLTNEFMELVVEPFMKAYSMGITPNPCILCNKYIKFPFLLKEAEKRASEFIATGHYARVEGGILKKGSDPKKDQSYVLYVLKKEQIKRLILPLGEWKKEDVRLSAKEAGLPVFDRPESQEICFVGKGRYSDFLSPFISQKEGPIFDLSGNIIGRHKGIYHYTIGQRKGLGISIKTPLYVVKIDTQANAIYVGHKEAVYRRAFSVQEINWLFEKEDSFRAQVKVRSTMPAMPASVYKEGEIVRVVFDEPQWAPTQGQSAVFYDGDIVVGGGIIKKVF